MPVHPVDDAVRTPCRSPAWPSGSKPAPRSRTNTSTRRPSTSAYTSICPVPACLAALVTASRVARRPAAAARRGAVAHADHLDGRRRGRPRPRRPHAQGAGHRALVGRVAGVQPGPQVALLGAGQPRHGRAVAGVLLDQRERLQHRVVQVGGHVGTLLGAHPLGPLRGQVGGQPVDPTDPRRSRARHPQQRRHGDVRASAIEPPRNANTTSATTISADEAAPGVRRPAAAAEDHAHGVDPAGGVDPALALRLVGLPPEQGDPDHAEDDRPEDRALARAPPRPAGCRRTPGRPARSPGRRRRVGGSGPGRRPPRSRSPAGGVVSNRESAGSTSHRPA